LIGDRGIPLASLWTKFKGVSPKSTGIKTSAVMRKIVWDRLFMRKAYFLKTGNPASGAASTHLSIIASTYKIRH